MRKSISYSQIIAVEIDSARINVPHACDDFIDDFSKDENLDQDGDVVMVENESVELEEDDLPDDEEHPGTVYDDDVRIEIEETDGPIIDEDD